MNLKKSDIPVMGSSDAKFSIGIYPFQIRSSSVLSVIRPVEVRFSSVQRPVEVRFSSVQRPVEVRFSSVQHPFYPLNVR